MSPAIHRGDWVVTRDVGDSIHRRDIVLYRFPLGTAGRAVKRVIAIGGDEVAIGDRSVTVDGHQIAIAGAPSAGAARHRVEAVPNGHVFLLGDNAAVSIDSRSIGAVPETEIVARVLFVVPKAALLALVGLAGIALAALGVVMLRPARAPRSPSRTA